MCATTNTHGTAVARERGATRPFSLSPSPSPLPQRQQQQPHTHYYPFQLSPNSRGGRQGVGGEPRLVLICPTIIIVCAFCCCVFGAGLKKRWPPSKGFLEITLPRRGHNHSSPPPQKKKVPTTGRATATATTTAFTLLHHYSTCCFPCPRKRLHTAACPLCCFGRAQCVSLLKCVLLPVL